MDKRDRVAARILALFVALIAVSVFVSVQLATLTSDYVMPIVNTEDALAKSALSTILFFLYGAVTVGLSTFFVRTRINRLPPPQEN